MTGKSRPSIVYLTISVLILGGTLATLAATASANRSPVWRLVALALGSNIPYAAALFAAWKARTRLNTAWPVIATALALRLILVSSPPVFSDDIYRYVWDAKVMDSGENPYRFAPDDPTLEPLRDDLWTKINHKSLRTIYPPLSEMVFFAIALVAPHPHGFKIASALADTCVVCLVILIAGGALRGPKKPQKERNTQETAIWAGLVYGLNPLACIETGMSGHLDPFAVALTLFALLLLKKNRGIASGFVAGLGAGIKLAPILLLPIIARRHRLAWVIPPLLIVALYLPFTSAGLKTVETLDTFGRRWEGNAGMFALVKGGTQTAIGFAMDADDKNSIVHLSFLDSLASGLDGTFFSLHKEGAFDPKRPGSFALGDLSLAVSKILGLIVIIATIITVTVRRVEPVRSAALVFGVLVIISPIMHPWYLLWILPYAAALNIWPWLFLASLSFMAYLPLDGWWAMGIWEAPPWIPWLEYGFFVLALIAYLILPRLKKTLL